MPAPSYPRPEDINDDDQPRRSLYPVLISLPVIVVLGLVGMLIYGEVRGPGEPTEPGPEPGQLSRGDPMPALVAAGWRNGDAPAPADLRGRVVVIDAWATWCGPCAEQVPHLVAMHKRFEDRGVVFIGLTSEGPRDVERIEEFLEHFEITWLNGYGADETLHELGADTIPRMWVFGPDGKMIWRSGFPKTPESAIEQALSPAPGKS
ncbi:MAG: TlpA family protein disulfide reductase [Planctomycetales bacterium]